MLNGRSSFEPSFFARASAAARCFPDRASVAVLRDAGVRTVIVHTELPGAERPADCGPAPAPAALGLRQERRGALLVSRIAR